MTRGMRSSHANGRRVSRGRMRSPRVTARRLTVVLILTIGAVAYGGPASAANPTIYVAPNETTPGMFTLMDIWASSSWGAGNQVLVTLRGTEVANGLTNSSGSYVSGDVSVPAGVVVCGANEVDWISSGDFITSTTVMVYCPTVQISPNPLDTGGGAATFSVAGSGYPPDRAVYLTLDGAALPFNDTYTDPSGAFTTSLSNPALACGTHQLTATSQPPVIPQWNIRSAAASTVQATPPIPASTTFTVVGAGCATTPPTSPSPSTPQQPPPSRFPPKIAANPAVITDGTLTHVTGSGFVPSQPVALTWQTPAGARLSDCSPDADSAPPLKANATGNIDTYCYARPHETLGAAQLVATQGVAHAAAPVVVEGGSMQPSSGGDDFIFRR